MIRIGICGFGYWGPNLYRNFAASPDFDVVAVSDPLAKCRDKAGCLNRQLALFPDTRELIDSGTCDAVAIATPVATHYDLAAYALRKLKRLAASGALGTVSYYDSLRVNLGLFQPDVNVLWDLAPHDFSIMNYLFDEEPVRLETTGYCHVNEHFP